MKSLSKKINKVISRYTWRTGVALTFGEVLHDLEASYTLSGTDEDYCIDCLKELVNEYIAEGFYVERVEVC